MVQRDVTTPAPLSPLPARRVLAAIVMVWVAASRHEEAGAGEAPDAREMLGPFGVHQGSLFYASLGVPPIEPAWTLPPGETRWRFRTDHSHTQKGPIVGGDTLQRQVKEYGAPLENSFLGQFHTWLAAEVERGILPWLQVGARIGFGGWDEQQDHFYFADERGLPAVSYEERDFYSIGATARQDDVQDAVINARASLAEWSLRGARGTVAASAFLKLPLGRPRNLVDAGTADAGLGLLGSIQGGRWAVHANLAGVAPAGEQNLFSAWTDAAISPFAVAGAAFVGRLSPLWSAGIQVQSATAAFRDVAFLDGAPLTVQAGARRAFESGFLELGCGAGLGEYSADWQVFAAWTKR